MRRAVVLLAIAVFAGCEVNLNSEGIVSRETKRFEVAGVPEVDLETFDGTIEIHSWDRNEVEVEIERRAMEQRLVDDMTLTAEQNGNRVVVKVVRPGRSDDEFDGVQIGVHFSPSARLRVALPRNSHVTAMSGDGAITIEDVNGKISLTTNDGSVRGTRVAGELFVRSGDGAIRLDRAEGALDVETEDGSITLDAKPTVLRARTSDGTIRLQVGEDSVMSGDWDLQTGDGSVVLTLPAEFNGVLDAGTRDGAVRANYPALGDAERAGEDRDERRRTLQATLGTGGRTLRIRTGDGSIRIE
jgi:DUF4097 and DUF4098 domain-containing protein YvlB